MIVQAVLCPCGGRITVWHSDPHTGILTGACPHCGTGDTVARHAPTEADRKMLAEHKYRMRGPMEAQDLRTCIDCPSTFWAKVAGRGNRRLRCETCRIKRHRDQKKAGEHLRQRSRKIEP